MEILRSYSGVPPQLKGATIAIGNFDGVHRGHQFILNMVRQQANREKCLGGVMIFDPHPRLFFQKDKPMFNLTDQTQKLDLFKKNEMDLAVILPFDDNLSKLSAEKFVKDVLVEGLEVSGVVIGYDFHFGAGRTGSPEVMKRLGEQYSFKVVVVEPVGSGTEVYSSSFIRDCLRNGDVAGAKKALGYWWRVRGEVERGDGRGDSLGFPTANICLENGQDLKHGIYAVNIYIGTKKYAGASYLGDRPTFGGGKPRLETFVFEFEGDLYNKMIEIEFIEFLREDESFEDVQSLKLQMEADCAKARQILANVA